MDLAYFLLSSLHDRPDQQRELMNSIIDVVSDSFFAKYDYLKDELESTNNDENEVKSMGHDELSDVDKWQKEGIERDIGDCIGILLAIGELPESDMDFCSYDIDAIEKIINQRRQWSALPYEKRKTVISDINHNSNADENTTFLTNQSRPYALLI